MSQRKTCSFACFLTLATLSFVLCAGLAAALVGLPARVEAVFGPPSPRLSRLQRFMLAAQLYAQSSALTMPTNPAGSEQLFHIELGESAGKIARRLQQQGIIPNADAFVAYLQYTGLDTTLQAGEYRLSPMLTPVQVAQTLQDATPAEVTFTVLAGWRVEEIAAALPSSGLNISPQDFLAEAGRPPRRYSFADGLPATASAEGFLFPGTYPLPRDLTAPGLISALLSSFESQVSADIRSGIASQGLTLYEGVVLASIVEREAMLDEEMPRIASVFLNRLAVGMKLDSDPTVQYALGFDRDTWWKNPLSLDDLQLVHPYNTYLNAGLPPGPICNPGLAALHAVAFPEKTPYFYFRAACDHSGRHLFAETFEQHKANACP